MKKKPAIHVNQLAMFDGGEKGEDLTPSKKSILNSILMKQEELRIGELDFQRWRPSMKQLREAAATKHSNRAKVDGEWYDVRFCKYLVQFMDSWRRRASGLAWEIEELKKLI